METSTAERMNSKSLKEMWLITIGHGLTHWYPATFYLLLPLIGDELGLSYSQIGFLMTFQYMVSSISNLPGGMLVDMVGKKGVLMALSLFWVGVPYFLMSFANSYWMLLLCVALVGIGNNLWHPTAIPALSQRYPERKGFVLSIHGMGANAGDALAPLAIGSLLALLSWKQVVVLNVLPGLLMSVVILVFLRRMQSVSKSSSRDAKGLSIRYYVSGLGGLFKNKSLLLISASSGFRSMTQNALLTFLPVYLVHEMNLSAAWAGLAMFTLQACGLIAAPVSGHLSDRLGRKKIIMGSMMMTAAVLIVMGTARHSAFFIVFVALLGFFLYAVRPVMQAWLMDATPKRMAGTSVGLLFGAQSLGSSVSPLIGGMIADRFGLFATFYFVAATIVLANLLIFFMPKEVAPGTSDSFPA